MQVLVIINVINDSFIDTSIFNAALQIEAKCDVLLIGDKLETTIAKLKNNTVIKQILYLEDESFKHLIVENILDNILNLVDVYTHILIEASTFGKNLLPKLAGCLGVGQISEVTEILSPDLFKRVCYASSILLEIESLETIKLLSVRTNRFSQVISNNNDTNYSASITKLDYNNSMSSNPIKFISNTLSNNEINLTNAKLVVSGGKSLISKENFNKYIHGLAEKLNAGVGCSRDAVEAGIAPNDLQIGQTGKVVAPDIYIAIGISGAVQHIAGIKDSKLIIAINEDESAPIFEYSDYGLVADLFEVIPQLINKL